MKWDGSYRIPLTFPANSRIGKMLLTLPLNSQTHVGLTVSHAGGLITVPGGPISNRHIIYDGDMQPEWVTIGFKDDCVAD